MEEQDNLYDLFKHNEHKLDERPTPMAWDRLEQRLDNRTSVHKRLLLRNYAAAASLLLLVSVAVFFAISDSSSPNVSMADAKTVESMNDLVYAEEPKPARPILMSHKEKVYYYQQDQLLASKTVNKKPNNNTRRDNKFELNNTEIALSDVQEEKEIDLLAENTVTSYAFDSNVAPRSSSKKFRKEYQASVTVPADNKSDLEGIVLAETEQIVGGSTSGDKTFHWNKDEEAEEVIAEIQQEAPKVDESEKEAESASGMIMETISKENLPGKRPYKEEKSTGYRSQDKSTSLSGGAITLEDQDDYKKERAIAKAEEAKAWKPKNKKSKSQKAEIISSAEQAPASPSIAASEPTMAPAPQQSSTYGNEMEAAEDITRDINLQSNQVQYEPITSSNYQMSAPEIDQFNWILGNWKDDSGQSLERWEKTDELTIKGRGHFIVNGDTLFTEGMKIKQIDDNLYYIVAVDDSKSEVFYKLKSFNNQLAVFENSNLEFPNQVIIQQNSNNNFTTTLQNSNPSQISGTQQNYLMNRNAISNEKATRNLHRSNK